MKAQAQATKRNGKVVWECVKPSTVAVENATDVSNTAAAPLPPAPAPAAVPQPEPPAVTSVASNEPVVVRVPISSAPTAPSGLKTTCMTAANTFDSDGMCPVVQYKGLTTWAYSYVDNRMSIALVTYDSSGSVVRNTAFDGARYVWQITLDAVNRTASVWGQGSSAVSAPWSLFAGEALVTATATPVISVQVIGTSAPAPAFGSVLDVVSGIPAPCVIATNNTTSSSTLSAMIDVTPTATSSCQK